MLKLKRHILKLYIKLARLTNKKVKYPKNITDKEKNAIQVFSKVLLNHNSELYYDFKTNECYIKLKSENMYIFLERLNLSIINSTYGYDVTISEDTERYLFEMYTRQLAKRRFEFKNDVLSKVSGSLEKTLQKLENL